MIVIETLNVYECKCCAREIPRPAKPVLAKFLQIEVAGMATKFRPDIHLVAPLVTDVRKRELTVTADGAPEPQVLTFDGTPTLISDERLQWPVGTNVTITVVDIDGSGNRSPTSAACTFTVIDTVAPPQPAAPTVGNFQQIEVPDPPPVEPPPA